MDGHGNIAPSDLLKACAGTELEMETTPNQTPICEFEVSKVMMPLETSPFEAAISHRWIQQGATSEPDTIPRRLVLTNVHTSSKLQFEMCFVDGVAGEVCEDL